ncbi:MAG: Dihydrolipoyllysine-residue acetyltransferase component of pyruvate dehydrogenase complex [Fimbriimonadaceae bacterium]|nr:Dihydrolipoyllysine-residue acetyltransferase component of pyruvate dehydrogenase complex [Fimbriimonadaceae bacterium]
MPVIAVRIPQMGEGLQEARLVATLKQPGDSVRRDEPIYQMETDKAVMDVESPYEGVLVEWVAEVDTVLPIGSAVARMEVAEGTKEMEVHGGAAEAAASETAAPAAPTATPSTRNASIPPRTRAYGKEKGLSDDQLSAIPSKTGKLMPEDVDAFLSSAGSAAPSAESPGGLYREVALSQKQRLLSSRLQRGSQLVVPGTIVVAANWEPIERLRAQVKASGDEFQPSSFTMFAFAVAQALKDFPMFRSTLRGDDTLRTYDAASLGIAVALPGDELVLAVVDRADQLSWRAFADQTREKIDLARGGKDQAHEAVTLSLTNMQAFGLRDAVPVVVPPGIATLFLGEVYNGLCNDVVDEIKLRRSVNLSLTFDHRLINGVGAADFLNRVRANVETISSLITP